MLQQINLHVIPGYCAWDYTPTRRGFDTFLGFYLGSQNHFSHDRDYKSHPDDPPAFYDFRKNEEVAKEGYDGVYSTLVFKDRTIDIINNVADERELNAYGNYKPFFLYLSFQATHAPLQARAEILAKVPQTTNPARDIYKAMVYDMDLAVGEIVKTLQLKNLSDDTILIVTSDNGGAISHGASNYPLRGTKGTLFEGGTRVPTFVHGPSHLLPRSGVISSKMVHITDWMPTILKLGGYEGDPADDLGLDGVDQLEALSSDLEVRQEMVYNLKVNPISGAYRFGPHKIIFGKKFNKQGWYDTDNTALQCSRMMKNKKLKRQSDHKQPKVKSKQNRKGRKIELQTSRKIAKTIMTEEPKNNRRKKQSKKKKSKTNNRSKSKRKKARAKKKLLEKKRKERQRKKKAKLRSRARENLNRRNQKTQKREKKRKERQDEKIEKKITKIWKDWLPTPSEEIQNMLRLRMDDCNWEDFSEAGHSENLHLIPRSSFQFGDIVQIKDPMLNAFNISSADEESEFDDYDDMSELTDEKLEKKFKKLDIAMYNVIEDPEERNDLRDKYPDIFEDLQRRVLKHLRNVVPEDFPPQDFSGHPRNFNGYFSPGWCSPNN